MTSSASSRPKVAHGAAAAALLALCACAGTPSPAPVAPKAALPDAPMVTMAPIANPERAAPVRHETPRPRVVEPAHHAAATKPPPAAPAATPPAPGGAVDPAAAARLRARGLEELNRGQVAKAVALLGQASRLDPGSAVIRRDLERAERINRAVHGPR